MFNKHGIWVYTRKIGDWVTGGAWVIGNSPKHDSSSYPGKNNGSFKVKIWIADPSKYGVDQYPTKDRSESNEWEYVRVMNGVLECQTGTERVCRYPLAYPDDGIDLPPSVGRRWQLPPDCKYASGVTICRQLATPPVYNGQGTDYEFHCWDTGSPKGLSPLHGPVNLQTWRHQFVQVFRGTLQFDCPEGEHPARVYFLNNNESVFIQSSSTIEWCEDVSGGYGIVIYF